MGAGCVYSPGNFGSERCDRGLPSCFFEHYFLLRRYLENKVYLPTPTSCLRLLFCVPLGPTKHI